MAVIVNGCCCASLRTAGLLHGWIGTALLILSIITTITHIANYNDLNEIAQSEADNIVRFQSSPYTLEALQVRLAIYCIDVLICVLLTVGIIKNKHALLLPWLILRALGLMIMIPAGLIFLIFTSVAFELKFIAVYAIYAIICGLFVWSWVVIYSLYEEIRKSAQKPSPPVYIQSPVPYNQSQNGQLPYKVLV